ncbi:hypothetical protein ACIPWF_23115 [Paenarthrobacter sp. NPDC089989]|uniref:hypothetical protein n=1 Tax=unclassified Paenarthrobacter TaxID=2634190 RepID=UPI00380D6BC2
MKLDVASLLAGPRGRRLCLELAMEADDEVRIAVFDLGYDRDPGAGKSRVMMSSFAPSGEVPPPMPKPTVAELADRMSRLDLHRINDALIQKALRRAVDTARYWQQPDGEDVLAADERLADALEHVARGVLATRAANDWGDQFSAQQWAVDWRSAADPTPLSRNPSQTLSEWTEHTLDVEFRSAWQLPADLRAQVSGEWWSIPYRLIQTMSRIPEGLDLIEDSLGWEEATVIPVSGSGRILEVEAAEDWVTLCRDFPSQVTASRRHDWYRTTGRDGHWVIPDWEQVATRWDAVHLTVNGYLHLAGRALEVDPAQGTASVIAGWNPDTTLWLTDRLRETEEPRQHWRRENNWDEWTLVRSF